MYIIYKTTNLINNKIYIGQDSHNDPKYLGSGLLLNRAVKKYGRENFKKEILEECQTKKELNEREKYWIKKLNSMNKEVGYNITKGGEGGDTTTNNPNYLNICYKKSINNKGKKKSKKHCNNISKGLKGHIVKQETKNKISKANKNKFSSNKNPAKRLDVRKKISKSVSGDKNGMYGKHHSEETKKKISKKLKGITKSNIVKYKMSKSQKNLFLKGIKSHKGENNPRFGVTVNVETKNKISKAIKGSKWLNNNKIQKYVKKQKINYYLSIGWVFGMLKQEKL